MLSLPAKYSKCTENLEKNAEPSGTLFHYTNWNGLVGILKSQQLWLTEYMQLTDTSEIQHGIDMIRSYILTNAPQGNVKLFWEAIFDDIQHIVSNVYDFFVFSFCMKSNYLSAWRDYANDGAGFSIGFKKEFFKGVGERQGDDAPPFGRGKAYYDFEDLEADIQKLMQITQDDLESEDALHDTDDAIAKRDNIAKYFTVTLLPFLSSIKHKAYEGEHEHRIYTAMPKAVSLQKFFSNGPDAQSPHLSSKKRVYFQFDLGNIAEIWVGPKLNFEHAEHDITKLLEEKGGSVGDIKIIPSCIPYKNR